MKVEDLFESRTDEGALDYIKGASRYGLERAAAKMAEKGRQMIEPFEKAHAAGKAASQRGDIARAKAEIPKLIQLLGRNAIELRQLSKQMKAVPTNEGLWDYLRGAGGAAGGAAKRVGGAIKGAAQQVGGAVKGAAQEVHAKGQRSSMAAKIEQLNANQERLGKRLYDISTQLGISPAEMQKLINTTLADNQAAAYGARMAFFKNVPQSSEQQAAPTAPSPAKPKQRVEPSMDSSSWELEPR